MAGWLIVCGTDERALDDRWRRATERVRRSGEIVDEALRGTSGLAAWRRVRGEFPGSGRITAAADGARIACVGHCGQSSRRAFAPPAVNGRNGAPRAVESSDNGARNEHFADEFDGAFALAMLHAGQDGVSIWTDRHRHYPVYLHRDAEFIVASTNIACLRPWLSNPAL